MKPTPDQDRAVRLVGRDVCVRAGAGSGKTRVLVDRAVWLTTRDEDPLPLSSLLAITFTEKAAAEMKERLAARLAEERRYEERAEVEWAWVSTIHGFCSRLLRENALEAGVDPAFRVLDEMEAPLLRREALAAVAGRWIAEGREALDDLVLLAMGEVEDEVLVVHEELRARGLAPEEVPVPEADPAAVRACLREIGKVLAMLPAFLPRVNSRVRGMLEEVLSRGSPPADPGPEAPSFAALRERLVRLAGAIRLTVPGDLKAVLEPLREELIPRCLSTGADVAVRPGLLALRGLLADFEREYRDRKDERGVLDFADLEIRARDLLRDHPEIREDVRRRFRQVLVDEVQDVNPVQASIIALVRSEGNHFAVGDVKQSIYGFRHAEPELFRRYSEEVGEEGLVTLRENFRSSPALVEFTNHCFRPLFGAEDPAGYQDMVAAADFAHDAGRGVEILLTEADRAEEGRILEAEAVARRIREIVDGEEIRIARPGGRRGEAVRFGDIALLFRALTRVKVWERAFEDHDVPYYVVKGRGFFQARETIDVLRLLACVANPRDEIALASVLRSPFAGLSEDGLVAITAAARRRGGRIGDLLEAPGAVEGLAGADRGAWRRSADLLGDLRRLAGRGTVREMLETALDRSGYSTLVHLLPGGPRRAANLRKALDLAEGMEDPTDLGAAIRLLEDYRTREARETEAPTGGEAEDVVRLLTVHAAKGLEFPVVILPDLSRAPGTFHRAIVPGPEGIAARASGDPPVPTNAWRRAVERRKDREAAEAVRLLYVAVTRAEERLILCGREGRGARRKGSWWGAICSVLDIDPARPAAAFGESGRTAPILRTGGDVPSGRREPAPVFRHADAIREGRLLGLATEADRAWAVELLDRAARPPPVSDGTCYQNTVSEILLFSDCPLRYRYRYGLGIPEQEFAEEGGQREDPPGGLDEMPPRETGVAVHEVLRVFDPRGSAPAIEVARERVAALWPGRDADRTAVEAAHRVEAFYAHEAGRAVRAADPEKVRREIPFLVRWVPDAAGPAGRGLILRGKIDLLYPGPDGELVIVDYKTGADHASYDLQLVAYAHALEAIAPADLRGRLVFLRRDGRVVVREVDVSPTARRDIEPLFLRFRDTLAAGGPWERGTEADCPRCAFFPWCPEARG